MKTRKVRIRLICLLLCLMVLTPCVSALGETTKVAAYLLRLREKPSTSSRVLDAYPRGTTVTILRKGTDWTKVRVHGKEGYMMTALLTYGRYKKPNESSGSSTPDSVKPSVSSGDTAYIIRGVRLNLREAASSSSEIIGSFRGGTKVTVLKKGKYWTYVEVQGLVGYMGTEYLTTEY